MKYKKVENRFFVKIEKGEEIIEILTKFCSDNNIRSGSISGIGGTNDVSIKYYGGNNNKYGR